MEHQMVLLELLAEVVADGLIEVKLSKKNTTKVT